MQRKTWAWILAGENKIPKPVHLQMKLNCMRNFLGRFVRRCPCLKQCSALPDCENKLPRGADMITPGFCPGRARTSCLARDGSGAGVSNPGAPCLKRAGRLALPAPAPSATPREWGLFPRHASQRTTLPISGFGGKDEAHMCPDCYSQAALGHLDGFRAGTRAGTEWGPRRVPEPGRGRMAGLHCTPAAAELPQAEFLVGKGIPRAPSTSLRPFSAFPLRQLLAPPSASLSQRRF